MPSAFPDQGVSSSSASTELELELLDDEDDVVLELLLDDELLELLDDDELFSILSLTSFVSMSLILAVMPLTSSAAGPDVSAVADRFEGGDALYCDFETDKVRVGKMRY